MAPSDNSKRTRGRDAQRDNIAVIYSLAQDVRSTLGPKGMDKMIVDGLGDIIVTNDGYTLLTEMRVNHPTAKLAIEAVVAQQQSVGDGTTSVLILAGEFLRRAQDLLDLNIHPTAIARGFRLAQELAQRILDDIAEPLSDDDEQIILSVAQTAMTGKGAESAKEHLAKLALRAVRKVSQAGDKGHVIDARGLKLERMVGGNLSDSELIDGVIVARERAHPHMPMQVEDARVAIIEQPLEIKNPELTTQIQISDPGQMQAFIEQEHRTLAEVAARLAKSGCNVLFCQQNIEEPADYFLSKANILAVRRVPQSDLVRISKATGAKIVSSAYALSEDDLGHAGRVREETLDNSSLIYVEDCKDPKAVTLLVRGGTDHAAEEARRAIEDAVGDISSILRNRKMVGGAGAVEVQLCRLLREAANNTLNGKERLVVEAFADALLVIPRTLVESSGLDQIEVVAEIEKKQASGQKWASFDVNSGEIVDSWKAQIIEPQQVKAQAIGAATEVAVMVLRIDDMFIGGTPNHE